MHMVQSKGKKTDFIALLVLGCFLCFFLNNMADAYCVWLLMGWGVVLFSVLRGMGQPSHSEKTWVQRTFLMERVWFTALRREEAKLGVILSEYSGWQGSILEYSFIFSAAEESLPEPFACSLKALLLSTWGEHRARLWPGGTSSQRGLA